MADTLNPLATDPKRETSGSSTFRKYRYQYHWAFCRMLDEHDSGNEYALFIEEHEDVTLANSLNGEIALFEFNQVKETSKTHTVDSLLKTTTKAPNSLLGKMASGAIGKSFSPRINKVNLVSTGGFSFDSKKKGYKFEAIEAGSLSKEESNKVRVSLIKEVGNDDLMDKLAFVIPNLPEKSFEDVVQGRIGKLIDKISPGCYCNSRNIYTCVIEDLYSKGENEFDYNKWDDAVKKKAVTSKQLNEIIGKHVSRKGDEALMGEVSQILNDEYKLKSLKRRRIINGFNRYYSNRLNSRDSMTEEVSREIRSLINTSRDDCEDAFALNEIITNSLSEHVKAAFNSDDEITGAFLYELIAGESNE